MDSRDPEGEFFVVERGPSAEKVVSGLTTELYEAPWRDPRDYVLIDARGNIKETFTVTTWSIEDELGVSVFAIAGGALRNLRVSVFCCDPVRVERNEKIVVDDLQMIAADDHQTRRFLSDALARDQQLLAEERRRQDRVAHARIAAIPGAGDEYGIGDDFRQAQELLCGRVKAWNAEIDGAMLRVLTRFGMLHRSLRATSGPGGAAPVIFAAALDSFVIACRLAAFDRSLEKNDVDSRLKENLRTFLALPAKNQTEWQELEKTLGSLERDLLQEAEGQEWSDARNNAIAFRAAAAHVARARKHLEQGSRPESGHGETPVAGATGDEPV